MILDWGKRLDDTDDKTIEVDKTTDVKEVNPMKLSLFHYKAFIWLLACVFKWKRCFSNTKQNHSCVHA